MLVFVSVLPLVARGLRIAAGALRTVWRSAPRSTRVALVLCTYALFWLGLAGIALGSYFVGAISSIVCCSVGGFAWLNFFLSFIVVRHVVILMFYDVAGKATQTSLTWLPGIVAALTAVQLASLAGTSAFGAIDNQNTLRLQVALNTMRAGEVLGLAVLIHAASRLRSAMEDAHAKLAPDLNSGSGLAGGSEISQLMLRLIQRSYRLIMQVALYTLSAAAETTAVAVDGILPNENALPVARYLFDRLVGLIFFLVAAQMAIWIIEYLRAPLLETAGKLPASAVKPSGNTSTSAVKTSGAIKNSAPATPGSSTTATATATATVTATATAPSPRAALTH